MEIYRQCRDELSSDLRLAHGSYLLAKLATSTDVPGLSKELASFGLVRPASPLNFFSPDELNVFFASVSRASLVCSDSDLASALAVPLNGQPVFEFANISPETFSLTIVSTTTLSYSTGPDGVSLFRIHSALPKLAPLLASLFNAILTTGHFPSFWKRAFIRPLLTHATPNLRADTRPIANLYEVSKVFDRVVHITYWFHRE